MSSNNPHTHNGAKMSCQRSKNKITKESVHIRSQTFLEYSVAVMPSYGYCLERFKIINQLTPVCLQNLVNVKKSKYSFKNNNIVDIHEVKTTTYGKKSFRYATAFQD
jgi:hypothetical protein